MSFFLVAIPQALYGALKDICYFPIWWYGRGLFEMIRGAGRSVANQAQTLAIGIWVVNLFTPMYGQYDWQGRLISFGVRFVQIIARSFLLMIWIFLALAVVVAWIALPLIIILALSYQFFPAV